MFVAMIFVNHLQNKYSYRPSLLNNLEKYVIPNPRDWPLMQVSRGNILSQQVSFANNHSDSPGRHSERYQIPAARSFVIDMQCSRS